MALESSYIYIFQNWPKQALQYVFVPSCVQILPKIPKGCPKWLTIIPMHYSVNLNHLK